MSRTPVFDHGTTARTGILLLNLGTPDAPTTSAVRRYLKQFLSDRRVIEIPRLLWWPLLNGVILNVRPRKSAKKYASIWTKDGSPLLVHTRAQAEGLRTELAARGMGDVVVEFAMRYGQPDVAGALAAMHAARVERLLVLPLYPQYSAASNASAIDGVFQVLMQQRNLPELRTVRHFHDHPAYIRTLAQQIQAYWQANGKADVLVMSFHGMPRFTLDRGDPYYCECMKTGRLLAQALDLAPENYRISFQSRFGRTEWLQPYTAATLQELGRQKVARLDVVCPGFVSDCLETLEEIGIEGRELFQNQGGGDYRVIPCLNSNSAWIAAMAEIIAPHLDGWGLDNQQDSHATRLRALQQGAPA
jgi:ferrochelatase